MTDYSNSALGRVVRDLRQEKGETQEGLGRKAGYGKGAGVSVSRLESGALRPGTEKFAGLANALGLKPEELEKRAAALTAEEAVRGADSTGGPGSRSPRDLKERARRIQHQLDDRTSVITTLGEEFNTQHERAREAFFMRFVEVAARIEGAPQPDASQLEDEDAGDPEAVAAYRLKASAYGLGHLLAAGAGGAAAGAAMGGAAAYGTFVAAASFGTASTGVAISTLSGVAATNATLAVLGGGTLAGGGAGMAGGSLLLTGIVAAPAALLLAGGLLWMAKRNRKQQQQLADQLDEAEAQLAATQPGYLALQDILPRAAELLDYIATHAGHAVGRWSDQLESGLLTWESLGDVDQQQYESFFDIATAQLTVVSINVQGILTASGDEREQLIQLADEVLTQTRDTVTTLV